MVEAKCSIVSNVAESTSPAPRIVIQLSVTSVATINGPHTFLVDADCSIIPTIANSARITPTSVVDLLVSVFVNVVHAICFQAKSDGLIENTVKLKVHANGTNCELKIINENESGSIHEKRFLCFEQKFN